MSEPTSHILAEQSVSSFCYLRLLQTPYGLRLGHSERAGNHYTELPITVLPEFREQGLGSVERFKAACANPKTAGRIHRHLRLSEEEEG